MGPPASRAGSPVNCTRSRHRASHGGTIHWRIEYKSSRCGGLRSTTNSQWPSHQAGWTGDSCSRSHMCLRRSGSAETSAKSLPVSGGGGVGRTRASCPCPSHADASPPSPAEAAASASWSALATPLTPPPPSSARRVLGPGALGRLPTTAWGDREVAPSRATDSKLQGFQGYGGRKTLVSRRLRSHWIQLVTSARVICHM
mmetsp:Transcript_14225/g.41940  ORF Transcript_14225/g.41940 Transcript_14225/m.41940 type:complete len:200 (-) Transcript_14225:1215-1814(-)